MMTAREKILSAFAPAGASAVGAVTAYEQIFIRDHYADITSAPWWDPMCADRRALDFVAATGLDWVGVAPCPSRRQRASRRYERRADGVWLIDDDTGRQQRLIEPAPGGANAAPTLPRSDTPPPTDNEQIDALIALDGPFDKNTFLDEGRHEAAAAVAAAVPVARKGSISSPLWSCFGHLGYETTMILLADQPELVGRAADRLLHNTLQQVRQLAAIGADVVWIEECLTDQISPGLFRDLNVPLLRQCISAIRCEGMKSVYYYCGSPHDRLESICGIGPDAIHFEESKKNFVIDIAEIIEKAAGRCTVFGNLDVAVIERSEPTDLRAAVQRQLDAAVGNGMRFVVSTGSPITPATSVQRVRMYSDMVRSLAGEG